MSKYLIGCSGWGGAQGAYVSRFPIVEIQSTFYDPSAPRVAARWRAIAPPGFVICLKAWQLITHASTSPTYRRLRRPITQDRRAFYGSFQDTIEVWQAWLTTLEIARTVDTSVVLFQCPGSFQPTPQNVQNLTHFFEKIGPQKFKLAWEPRGAWPPELVRDLCSAHDLIHCVDPLKDTSVYGKPRYWRLHGKDSYSYRYTDDDLTTLQMLLARSDEPAYVLFNNFTMKADAERFKQLLLRE